MALAEFFGRVGDSAAQVLANYDQAAFARRLDECAVTIAFDCSINSAEGGAALDMLVRLLARLFPRLAFRSLDGTAAAHATETARAINPLIEFAHESSERMCTVVIGATEITGDTVIYLGSNGWLAKIGTEQPLACGTTDIPFGAGAAACIAAANVFRWAFAEALENPALDKRLVISVLDFKHGARAANPALPAERDLGQFSMVGLGAIGNAAVWALGRMTGSTGAIDLIDHERIELSNLQRYVLADRGSVGAEKVEVMKRFLPGFAVRTYPMRWREFLLATGTHHHGLVAVALDTARDRVLLQGSLPREIINSWTQRGDLGISRHPNFSGDGPCLACLYLDPRPSRNDDEILAEELGIPEQAKNIGHMLHLAQPVGEAFVRELAARKGVSEIELLKFADLPLWEFRAKAVCGGGLFSSVSTKNAVEVPMAFQSALAGVLLAGEIVATRLALRRAPLPPKTTVDLMRPISKILNFPASKNADARSRCICRDNDYLSVYAKKYEVAP